jgi:uncharacterized phage protein (TIGR01671 family)
MEDRYFFKAKRVDNGEWVIGQYVNTCYPKDCKKTGHFIVEYPNHFHEIYTSTLCQCTGLKDKNGNLIWENDIVRFKHEKFDFDDGLEPFERTCLPNKKEYKRNYVVEFCNTPTHYGLRFRNSSIWFMVHKMTVVMHDTEVIGNIFDNPELLESEEQYGENI